MSREQYMTVPYSSIFLEDVLRIRNQSREFFFDSNEVDLETHKRFMEKRGDTYRVCLNAKGDAIGYARLDDYGDISVAVEPASRGKGAGLFLLKDLVKRNPDRTLIARVLEDNEASKRAFEAAGFKLKHLHYEAGGED